MSLEPALQGRVEVVPVGGVDEEENRGKENSEGKQDGKQAGGQDETSGGRPRLLVDRRPGHLLPHLVVDGSILQPGLVVGGLLHHPGLLGQGVGWLVLTVTSLPHPGIRGTLAILTTTARHHSLMLARLLLLDQRERERVSNYVTTTNNGYVYICSV